jgi:uncharacterized SAM-binding protein YcdF (DUF218 family)
MSTRTLADAAPLRPVGSRRLVGRSVLALMLALTLGGGYALGGFIRFAQDVATFGRAGGIGEADGIVVLTGGAERLDQAVDLLKRGKARRLLISGVNPGTTASTLSRLTETDRRLFDCCVDLDYAALNTVGNAEMTERWAREQGFDDLILVTSDYHMPRTLIEFERIAHVPTIRPYAVVRPDLWAGDSALPSGLGVKVLVVEYAKLIAARLRASAGLSGPAVLGEAVHVAHRES